MLTVVVPIAVAVGLMMLTLIAPPERLLMRASAMLPERETISIVPSGASASARRVAVAATVVSTLALATALTSVLPTEIVPPPSTLALACAPRVGSVTLAGYGKLCSAPIEIEPPVMVEPAGTLVRSVGLSVAVTSTLAIATISETVNTLPIALAAVVTSDLATIAPDAVTVPPRRACDRRVRRRVDRRLGERAEDRAADRAAGRVGARGDRPEHGQARRGVQRAVERGGRGAGGGRERDDRADPDRAATAERAAVGLGEARSCWS